MFDIDTSNNQPAIITIIVIIIVVIGMNWKSVLFSLKKKKGGTQRYKMEAYKSVLWQKKKRFGNN